MWIGGNGKSNRGGSNETVKRGGGGDVDIATSMVGVDEVEGEVAPDYSLCNCAKVPSGVRVVALGGTRWDREVGYKSKSSPSSAR